MGVFGMVVALDNYINNENAHICRKSDQNANLYQSKGLLYDIGVHS